MFLLGLGNERTIQVWDTRSSKRATTISTAGENIGLHWSPGGEHLVSNQFQAYLHDKQMQLLL